MLTDLRLAVRSLLRRPGPHLVAVAVLALGIGAAVLVFSLVHALLLEPLPVADAGRLVRVFAADDAGAERQRLEVGAWRAVRDEARTLDRTVAAFNMGLPVTDSERPLNPLMRRVSPGWLELVGARAERGRTFVDEDFAGNGRRVVVLAWAFWQGHFGADPAVVGRTIQLAYEDYEIVGVLPASHRSPVFPDSPVLLLPMTDATPPPAGAASLVVLGRLAAGATTAAAATELEHLAAELRAAPGAPRGLRLPVVPLRDSLVEGIRPALLILAAAVALVLLVACANVSNLLLARAVSRSGEMTLRRALGARGGHLLRQLAAEGLVLGTSAAAAGVLAAWAALGPLVRLAPANVNVPLLENVRLHPAVLLFAAGLVVLTTLVFALLPLLPLRTGARGGTRVTETASGVRLRRGLVVAEIAFSVVLASSAGLMVRSLASLRELPLGFEPDGVLVGRATARGPGLATPDRWEPFHRAVVERLAARPEVAAVGTAEFLPMFAGGFGRRQPVAADAAGPAPADGPRAVVLRATPGYFAAFGQPLLAGRDLAWSDGADAPGVAVVSRALASRLWGDADPVGRRLALGERTVEVVGVAGDLRGLVDAPEPAPLVFVPLAQDPLAAASQSYFLRAVPGVDPAGLETAVVDAVGALSRDAPTFGFLTLEALVRDLEWRPRFLMQLLATFAGLGLVLAATGVYSVLSYAVAARRREMGIRLAVGARRGAVVRLVEGEVLALAALGVAFGTLGTLVVGRLLAGELHGVSASDPATLATTGAVLTVSALAAGLAPAVRAARTDPATVLREG